MVTLIAGRAHQKHTQGGDFRQASIPGDAPGPEKGAERLAGTVFPF